MPLINTNQTKNHCQLTFFKKPGSNTIRDAGRSVTVTDLSYLFFPVFNLFARQGLPFPGLNLRFNGAT